MRLTHYSALVGAVATMSLLAACGSDSKSAASTAAPTTTAAAATTAAPTTAAATTAAPTTSAAASTSTKETTATSAGAATGVTVALAKTPLGNVLVDQDGRTLYLFQKDTPGSPSVCSGGCAAAWPALTATAPPKAGDGVGADDLSLIKNADGTMQVAFYGYPLYHYAQDSAPGDTHGQGVGGVWWVVGADGKPIGAPA